MTASVDRSPHRLAILGRARPVRRAGPRSFDPAALAAAVPAPVVVVRDPLPIARRRRLEPLLVALADDADLFLLITDPAGLRALTALDLPPSVLWGMRVLVVDAGEAALPAEGRPRRGGTPACPVDWAATATGPQARRWLIRTARERATAAA